MCCENHRSGWVAQNVVWTRSQLSYRSFKLFGVGLRSSSHRETYVAIDLNSCHLGVGNLSAFEVVLFIQAVMDIGSFVGAC